LLIVCCDDPTLKFCLNNDFIYLCLWFYKIWTKIELCFFLVCGLSLPNLGHMIGLTHKILKPCLAHFIFAKKTIFSPVKVYLANSILAFIMYFSSLYLWSIAKQTPNGFKKLWKISGTILKLFVEPSHIFQQFHLIFRL